MDTNGEQLAIIKNVGYGLRDIGHPCLWFDTMVEDSTGALQVFRGEEAGPIIEDAGVYDVHEMEGKACWVIKDEGMIKFLRMAKFVG
jgi:hypothetical protein